MRPYSPRYFSSCSTVMRRTITKARTTAASISESLARATRPAVIRMPGSSLRKMAASHASHYHGSSA